RSDYAGNEYILEFIQGSAVPVAMAANVEDDPKLKKLAQKSLVIRFVPVNEQMLLVYLESVVRREKLKVEADSLKQIAADSKGDVRSALNMLQT
ncbi:MAG: hypothetical protein M1368_06325, partial [Thaumarchaeota archaeon]|nr:hypothetical protein [Nitrososphaerota archaeon]